MNTSKTNILILIFGLLITTNAFACICTVKKLSDLQKSEFENSEHIFIGEVFQINKTDLTFKIKVTESLNGGDEIGKIYTGKNWKYCYPIISEKGKWLIYGNLENGFLRLNMCGISRSFNYPVIHPLPPPLPELNENKMTENDLEKISEKVQTENMKIAFTELELEIVALRKRRSEK